MATKQIDFSIIKTMSEQQQQQAYATLAKRANQRFTDIAKSGNQSYAGQIAKSYLRDVYGREKFKQSKKLTGEELKNNLQALQDFFEAKSSSISGIKAIAKEHDKAFADKGIKIKDRKKFYDFLSSQTFKTLGKQADSDQVAEDFNKAMEEGFSFDEIMESYQEFLENDMTFEEVAERRQKAGGLLK